MKRILLTGGSGFFGGILKRRLLAEGYAVTNIDLVSDPGTHQHLVSIRGDIRDRALLGKVFAEGDFTAVLHCAAMLAHDTVSSADLWASNVDGTRNLAEGCRTAGVRKLIFISSNCLWGHNAGHAIAEDEPPAPVELYGRSKLAGEEALADFPDLDIVILRSPTIMDSGRLGLLAILFEFIADGRRVWVVGSGGNRYQFIYAQDLATACIQSLDYTRGAGSGPAIFHIGSDHVASMREVYQSVIDFARTGARVASLPQGPTIAAMKLAHKLGVSPLGPYHYRMIAEDFLFDTTKIRRELGWSPTLTNEQMMIEAFRYYSDNKQEIHARTDVSAHSRPASMGIIRLLKWLS